MSSEPQAPGPALRPFRLSRSALFMQVAHLFGQRSSCPRADVGCIATIDGRIIASGYVGAPQGQPHCDEVGCLMENEHCMRTIHAEANLVAWASRVGTSLQGSTVWCTHSPCRKCVQLMSNAGIERFHWHHIYDYRSLDYMFELGITGTRQLIPGEPLQ